MRRRIEDAARAMEGQVIAGDGSALWSGAALDSRRVAGGELFFALAGEATDGHRFVGAALARGAAAAVVERPEAIPDPAALPEGACLVRVTDVFRGLHALVRHLREDLPDVLVGITGSVGKTTTKELVGAVLAERFRTARTPGNLNNLYGFPLAYLGIPDDTEVMVAELGMSLPGELGRVSALARPDGVVLTAVRPAHLENFADVQAIAEAKAEIFDGVPATGGRAARAFAVANRDDPQVVRVTERWAAAGTGPGETAQGSRRRVIWYGLGDDPAIAVRGRDVRPAVLGHGRDGRVGIRFRIDLEAEPGAANGRAPESGEVEVPLHGRYNASNALAAAGVGLALGLDLAAIRRGLARVRASEHRGTVHRLADGTILVDDAYNSNPDALAEALASARDLREALSGGAGETEEAAAPAPMGTSDGGRLVAILGDMLELGPGAPDFHRAAGRRAAELGFDPVVGVGPLAEELVAAARDAGAGTAVHRADAAAAADWAERAVRPGDLVLVKGSRGIGLETVVERLLGRIAGGRAAAAGARTAEGAA